MEALPGTLLVIKLVFGQLLKAGDLQGHVMHESHGLGDEQDA